MSSKLPFISDVMFCAVRVMDRDMLYINASVASWNCVSLWKARHYILHKATKHVKKCNIYINIATRNALPWEVLPQSDSFACVMCWKKSEKHDDKKIDVPLPEEYFFLRSDWWRQQLIPFIFCKRSSMMNSPSARQLPHRPTKTQQDNKQN